MNEHQYDNFTSQLRSPANGFCAKLTNPKVLAHILKMLNFREEVTINVGINGLKISAEISKAFQANVFIQRETFLEYKISDTIHENDEDAVFNISISTLIQCLNLCGTGGGMGSMSASGMPTSHNNMLISNLTTSSMVLYYSDIGDPLRIWIEEDGIISGANIPTMDGTDTLSFDDAHLNTNIIARIIMLTGYLKDVLQELDSKTDYVEFVMCPTEKIFSLSTSESGVVDFCVEIPFDSEIVSHSEVTEYVCVRYQLSLLRHALKPITMAEKVSIRIDARKLLSIQYMIQLNDDTKSYMEFYCAPDVDID